MDESVDNDGVFVLAGHVASEESWARFTEEWTSLVQRFGRLGQDGKRSFHMAEMRAFAPDDIAPFFRAIEDHVALSLSCTINQMDLRRAIHRLRFMPIDWGLFRNPYYICFRVLMDMFHSRRALISQFVGMTEQVSFTFDDGRHEQEAIVAGWEGYLASRGPEVRLRYGTPPRFLNDKSCPPLQAADFYAWWVRKWTVDGVREQYMDGYDYDGIVGKRRPFPKIAIEYSLDDLMLTFKKMILESAPAAMIFDVDD